MEIGIIDQCCKFEFTAQSVVVVNLLTPHRIVVRAFANIENLEDLERTISVVRARSQRSGRAHLVVARVHGSERRNGLTAMSFVASAVFPKNAD